MCVLVGVVCVCVCVCGLSFFNDNVFCSIYTVVLQMQFLCTCISLIIVFATRNARGKCYLYK